MQFVGKAKRKLAEFRNAFAISQQKTPVKL